MLLIAVTALGFPAAALADPPDAPTITEPGVDRKPHPADVHMEATGFHDPDGDIHQCTRWEIWAVQPEERVWSSPCAIDVLKVHIHLGDGTFEGSLAGDTQLEYDTEYELRARFEDSTGELSPAAVRRFTTSAAGPPGQAAADPWAVRQPGYVVDVVASGFRLPVNVAMVPNPGDAPTDPLAYVVELYGSIQTVTNNGEIREYAHGLLNFDPEGPFPGSGEQGTAGIAVDPGSDDLFVTTMYEDGASLEDPKPHYGKVIRFHSTDGGLTGSSQHTVLELSGGAQGPSHQISNVTIGPDGNLYVHTGDGFQTDAARNIDDWRGKVLRMQPDGDPVPTNPFYSPADAGGDGLPDPRDYVFAYGFRNPFGGAWRAADGAHYEVENGPDVDRFARIDSGVDYGWDGTNASMRTGALYNWDPSTAPVNLAFVQPATFSGSGFPAAAMGDAFVTESGPTYVAGPSRFGKRISELAPQGSGFQAPRPLVEYTGTGRATASGLAAGPGGLYFTDLYDDGASSPTSAGAKLLRVRYAGTSAQGAPETTITDGPRHKLTTRRKRKRYSFSLQASHPGAEFECKRDKREFEPCSTPYRPWVRAHRKRFKKHVLLVRATDVGGTDPSPAKYRWKLKRKRRP